MDYGLPGSLVHGIFQVRVQEWVAISFSRESSQHRNQTFVPHIAGWCFRSEPQGKKEEKRDRKWIWGNYGCNLSKSEERNRYPCKEVCRVPNKMNTNRQTARHIIIKNDKFTENFKGSKRKIVIYIRKFTKGYQPISLQKLTGQKGSWYIQRSEVKNLQPRITNQ